MQSTLLRRPVSGGARNVVSIAPDGKTWNYVRFDVVRLAAGDVYDGPAGADETIVVFIEGNAEVRCSTFLWERVGGRASPFDGPPQAVYVPSDVPFRIRAHDRCEIAICQSRGDASRPPRLISCGENGARLRGAGNAQRRVYDILMGENDAASLFVTEVVTPQGHWSSYPPHKHDSDNPPFESALEELYYYRARPASGFAFQRVYAADGDLDETITAHDRDVVLVPRGYHVCAAAAGYDVYYLNVLAGSKHVYRMTFDPQHEWIKEGWTW